MAFLSKLLPRIGVPRPKLTTRAFPSTFSRISSDQKVEEENFPFYQPTRYYPVHIGEILASRYQVVGKLGFGVTSTAWLARDLVQHDHVVVKVFARTKDLDERQHNEINTYQTIKCVSKTSSHPGRNAIRTVVDDFHLTGPAGDHQCLVHPPLWESARNVLYMNPARRFPPMMTAMLLRQVFLALDFLHTECHLIHTDIKADNLVYRLDPSDPVLAQFEQAEIDTPSPRKETKDGHFIYVSRHMAMPQSLGYPVLCDFGSAMPGDAVNKADVQPDAYRSPEMILRIPWSYPIDIWNVGCMVWDLCQGGHLFEYDDAEDHMYRGSVHLASIMSLLGPVPPNIFSKLTFHFTPHTVCLLTALVSNMASFISLLSCLD